MSNQTPPRVPLVFRVGIVGHRPNRLANADLPGLTEVVRTVLAEIQASVQAFQDNNPGLYLSELMLRAITPLAEGTDRIFAQQALDLGFALCCPMPFSQAEYEKDFLAPSASEARSLDQFRELLSRARTGYGLATFELDGDRATSSEAYGAAGRVVLNQSDLLVVVWDGERSAGKGGTVDTLQEAVNYRVPVVWIDAAAPHSWCVLGENPDLRCLQGGGRCVPSHGVNTAVSDLQRVVHATLELPPGETEPQEAFFLERKPKWNPAMAWKFFRHQLGEGKLKIQNPILADFEDAVEKDWSSAAGGVAAWVNERLRPHYAWSDKPADIYADHHRSAFVLAYPVAAFAVLLALLSNVIIVPGYESAVEAVLVLLELAAIGWVFYLISVGRRRRWHDRWLDYRLLAEYVRQLRILIPLGGGRPFPRLPLHLETYGSPSQTWMSWHARAISRAVGIPEARADDAYARQCLAYLKSVVDGQRDFHVSNMNRSLRIEYRLHHGAEILLGVTVLAMMTHLVLLAAGPEPGGHLLPALLTLCCAFFPAMGAAFAGINNQGEFARLARRSRAMAERLSGMSAELGALADSQSDVKLHQVTPMALDVAQLMVDEVLDWRVVFLDRPPRLPV